MGDKTDRLLDELLSTAGASKWAARPVVSARTARPKPIAKSVCPTTVLVDRPRLYALGARGRT